MFDNPNFTAADVMSRDVVTVRPNDTLRHAAQIMLDRAIRGCRWSMPRDTSSASSRKCAT